MAKKCMQCGGSTKKMAKGGMPSTTPILGPPKKPFAAGIPFYTGAGQTGPSSMKRGGAVKKMQTGGPAKPAKPRDPRITVSSGASAPQPYSVNTQTYGGKPLTQAEVDALNKKARIDRAAGRMQTGGTKMVSWMKDGLSKSTGKRRIVDSKVSMTGPDAPMGKTPMAQMGGSTVKARKTITGGTRVKTNNGENVTVTRRNKAGNITKQSARKAVKGWSEDEYKMGGATKAKKFAALAPPYNKATAADRIAGAKKNAKKK